MQILKLHIFYLYLIYSVLFIILLKGQRLIADARVNKCDWLAAYASHVLKINLKAPHGNANLRDYN